MSAKLTKEIVNSRILDRGIQLIGEYSGNNMNTDFQCKCGNIWSARPGNIMSNRGCPVCSIKIMADKQRLSKEIVNSRILDRGIQLIGEYIDAKIKTNFQCECGHLWSTTSDSIMSGCGCPSCAAYGFNPGRPAWIYILIFANFIKYGITNDLDRRLKDHLKNGEYTVALSKLYEDGSIAQNWERDIKIIFGGRFVSKEIMPDGYTETLSLDKLQALLDSVR